MTTPRMQPKVYYYAAATNGQEVFGTSLFRDLNLPGWLFPYEKTFSNFYTPRRLPRGYEFVWQSWRLRTSHGLNEALKRALSTVQLRLEVNSRRVVDVPVLIPLLNGGETLHEPVRLTSEHDLGGEMYLDPQLYAAAAAGSWVDLIEKNVPCDCRVPALAEAMRDVGLRGAVEAVWRLAGPAAVWAAVCRQPETHAAQPSGPPATTSMPFLIWIELCGLGLGPIS